MPTPPKIGDRLNGYQFLGGDPSQAASWAPLSGEDYLSSLPDSTALIISMNTG